MSIALIARAGTVVIDQRLLPDIDGEDEDARAGRIDEMREKMMRRCAAAVGAARNDLAALQQAPGAIADRRRQMLAALIDGGQSPVVEDAEPGQRIERILARRADGSIAGERIVTFDAHEPPARVAAALARVRAEMRSIAPDATPRRASDEEFARRRAKHPAPREPVYIALVDDDGFRSGVPVDVPDDAADEDMPGIIDAELRRWQATAPAGVTARVMTTAEFAEIAAKPRRVVASQVKAEAARRIEAVGWPLWRQLNTATGGDKAAIAAMRAAIDPIRAASDRLEAMSPIPVDYDADKWWRPA